MSEEDAYLTYLRKRKLQRALDDLRASLPIMVIMTIVVIAVTIWQRL